MPRLKIAQENLAPIELYYEDHGSGDPVVLIHGWPLSSASWEKQIPALLKAGHRVITYDRRGFGMSDQPATGYDADTLASDLNLLLEYLDVWNATLVGFSMGGVEVARYLGKYGTERVKKAALISAVTPYLLKTPENEEGVPEQIFDDMKTDIASDRFKFLTGFFKKFYNMGMFRGANISDEAAHFSWIIASMASPIATHDIIDSWLRDYRADLSGTGIPFLVVHGTEDQTVPYESSGKRVPEFIPDCKLVAIDGAPHGLNWTHAEKLNEVLLAFTHSDTRVNVNDPRGLRTDAMNPNERPDAYTANL